MSGQIVALVVLLGLAACAGGEPSETVPGPATQTDSSAEAPTVVRIQLPDVVGLTEREATRILRGFGFRVVTERADSQTDRDLGTVKSQKPPAGQQARVDSIVRLAIYEEAPQSREVEQPTERDLTAPQEAELLATFVDDESVATLLDNLVEDGSVDKRLLNRDSDVIELAVTSQWEGDERQRDTAWIIARVMGELLWSGDIAWLDDYEFGLDLTVDAHRFRCPPAIMFDVGHTRASRADWEAACS